MFGSSKANENAAALNGGKKKEVNLEDLMPSFSVNTQNIKEAKLELSKEAKG